MTNIEITVCIVLFAAVILAVGKYDFNKSKVKN